MLREIKVAVFQIQRVEESDPRWQIIRESIFWDLPKDVDTVNFTETNYKLVYQEDYSQIEEKTDMQILDSLYGWLNVNHPKGYAGRSLSVSDVVQINDKFYRCEGFGWKEVNVNL